MKASNGAVAATAIGDSARGDEELDVDATPTIKRRAVAEDGAAYDAIADDYDAMAEQGFVPHRDIFPWLDRYLGLDTRHAYVTGIDICCGTGRYTRHMAEVGLRAVAGIDISDRSLEIARRQERERPAGIRYVHGDVQRDDLDLGSFDLAACSLGMCDVPDLAAALRFVVRHLAPGGRFAFAIPHPAAPSLDGRGGIAWRETPYFGRRPESSPNPNSIRRHVRVFQRPLFVYLNMGRAAGLSFEEMVELPAPEHVVAQAREMERHPYLLIACFTKPSELA